MDRIYLTQKILQLEKMAKRRRKSEGTKKDSGKKFTFSADRTELTNLINVLETKKEKVIIPKLKIEKKIEEKTEETIEEIELKSKTEEKSKETTENLELESKTDEKTEDLEIESKTEEVIEQEQLKELKPEEIEEQNKKEEILTEEKEKNKSIFDDIGTFLEELLLDSYVKRYEYWEDSTNSMLAVLRTIQMTNRKNSEFLAETIEKFRERISIGLDRFKIKRDYVEKFSETNSAEISDMLKKTLNLLALQLKEFKIKNQLNQIILK